MGVKDRLGILPGNGGGGLPSISRASNYPLADGGEPVHAARGARRGPADVVGATALCASALAAATSPRADATTLTMVAPAVAPFLIRAQHEPATNRAASPVWNRDFEKARVSPPAVRRRGPARRRELRTSMPPCAARTSYSCANALAKEPLVRGRLAATRAAHLDLVGAFNTR